MTYFFFFKAYCFAVDQSVCNNNVIHFIRQRIQKGDFREQNSIEFSVVTLFLKVQFS